MQTLSVNSLLRLAAAFLSVFLGFGLLTAAPAQAVESAPSSESGLNADEMKRLAGMPQAERDGIRDGLNRELAKEACKPNPLSALLIGQGCEDLAAGAFGRILTTPEQSIDYDPATDRAGFCAGLAAENAPDPAVLACSAMTAWENFKPVAGTALRTAIALQPNGQFILGVADTVAFIADAKNGFENFANSVKDEGVKATNEVLNNLLKVSTFEIDDSFRSLWAIFAGVGIVIMALMYLKLFRDISDEKIDLDTARQSIFWFGPLSMVFVLFGPAMGYVINGWLMQLTGSFTPWTSTQIMDFATAISRFAGYESNGVFGPLAAVLLFGLMFIGAWALLGLFALQPFALYMLGVGLALMVGFLIHPEYRQRVGKTASLWLGIALSKPLILLLMGALFSFVSSRPAFQGDGVDDALVNAASVFLAGSAMLVLAFSPALLFKFVPLLPSSATSYGAGRPSIAGAAMVAGTGAALGSMIRNRRINQNQSGSGSGGSSGGGAGRSSGGGASRSGGGGGGGTTGTAGSTGGGGGQSIGGGVPTGGGSPADGALAGVSPGGGGQGTTGGPSTSRGMPREESGGQASGGQGSTQSQGSGGQGSTPSPGSGGRPISGGQGSGGGSAPDTRTIAEMQRDDRASTVSGKAGKTMKAGAGAAARGTAFAARGSAKVAAGGATAFLLAGRESARQAAMRGRQGVGSMAPDTDHISGR